MLHAHRFLTSDTKRIIMQSSTNRDNPPPDALCSLASSTVFGKTSNLRSSASASPSISPLAHKFRKSKWCFSKTD